MEQKDLNVETTVTGIDRSQFEYIFRSHYETIRNYIYYKSGRIEEAEDIAQEAFMKIWEKRETIIQSTVKPLLYNIAGNIFLNRQQHRKIRLRFALQHDHEGVSTSPEFDLEMKEFMELINTEQNTLDSISILYNAWALHTCILHIHMNYTWT